MDFKRLKKHTNAWFWASLIVSVAFVAAIPGLVLSAVHGITFLLVICIVCLAGGFYAMPLLWINFGNTVGFKRLLVAVDAENLYSVEELSNHLGKTPAQVRSQLKAAIQKRYITDYLFVDDALVLNENRKQRKKVAGNQCRNCGAPLVMTDDGLVCPYCGALFVEPAEQKKV